MVARIAEELAAAVLPGYRDAIAARRAAVPQAAGRPISDTPRIDALRGEWQGTIHTPDDTVALRLVVQADGDVHVRLGDGLWTLLNGVTAPDGARLIGRFAGSLPDRDARRHEHSVLLDVWLRDGMLSGQASAQTTGWPYYFALTSYVELSRVP